MGKKVQKIPIPQIKKNKKLFKNLLTNPHFCGIIITVRKRNEDKTMLFNKAKRPINQDTTLDQKIKVLNSERLAAAYAIRERAQKVIICNGAIDLYYDGADKEKAIKDAESAKYSLLCAIGNYDDLRRQYNEALCQEGERNTTAYWHKATKTSHEWVEMAYEEFWKK